MAPGRMTYLLDTNVFREVQKGPAGHRNVRAWLGTVDDADLRLSVMTIVEVRRGIERLSATKPAAAAELHARLAELLAAYAGRVVPIGAEVAAEWGRLQGVKDKHREDLAFAATARIHGFVLVTRNGKDVRGRSVKVLDPFKRPSVVVEV